MNIIIAYIVQKVNIFECICLCTQILPIPFLGQTTS